MKIIVVGCGRVGAQLAYRLYQNGHQVVVIDPQSTTFDNLPPDFHGRTVEGEVLNRDVLRRAGIEGADALAAVTNFDSLNTVVAHVARTVYHVPHVVVRNYNPHWRPLQEAFGVQVLSPSSWGAQRIEEMLYQSSMQTVFSAGNGEVEIYELFVPESWRGRPLRDIFEGSEAIPVSVTRAGRAMLPRPEIRLQADDIVHLSATLQGSETVRQRLNLDERP